MDYRQAEALWERLTALGLRKMPTLISLNAFDGKAYYWLETEMHPENIAAKFRQSGGRRVSVRRIPGKSQLKVVVSGYHPSVDLDDLVRAVSDNWRKIYEVP